MAELASRITGKVVTDGPTHGVSVKDKVDLVYEQFYKLSENHGYDVILEKAIKCPCSVAGDRSTSSCRNCGGAGWIFVNPQNILVVMQSTRIHSPEATNDESDLLYAHGKIKITALPDFRLSYMDKLTVKNAQVEFSESLPLAFDKKTGKFVARLIYPPIEIGYIGAFKSKEEKLIKIDSGYEVSGDCIYFSQELFESIPKEESAAQSTLDFASQSTQSIGLTIRYSHNPIYHIFENIRDFMTVKIKSEGSLISKPSLTLSIGTKRALMIDKTHYLQEPILDNSWKQ